MLPEKEEEIGVIIAGGKDNSLAWSILLLPIYRIRKKGTLCQWAKVGWRGAFRFGKFHRQRIVRSVTAKPKKGKNVIGNRVKQ